MRPVLPPPGREERGRPDALPVPYAVLVQEAAKRGNIAAVLNIRQQGDRLGDYPASDLKSIGFWVDNRSGQGTARDWVRSVAEIERLTGFEFFPTVDAAVKTQRDAVSWGL